MCVCVFLDLTIYLNTECTSIYHLGDKFYFIQKCNGKIVITTRTDLFRKLHYYIYRHAITSKYLLYTHNSPRTASHTTYNYRLFKGG